MFHANAPYLQVNVRTAQSTHIDCCTMVNKVACSSSFIIKSLFFSYKSAHNQSSVLMIMVVTTIMMMMTVTISMAIIILIMMTTIGITIVLINYIVL